MHLEKLREGQLQNGKQCFFFNLAWYGALLIGFRIFDNSVFPPSVKMGKSANWVSVVKFTPEEAEKLYCFLRENGLPLDDSIHDAIRNLL